jgi:phosphate-selective porin OprO and OprP
MNRSTFASALLGASALLALGAAQAHAQEPAVEEAGVVSDAPAPDEASANNEFLQAQVESLQEQIDALKKQMTAAQPTWKGAPQWTDADSGFSFKVRGRFMWDTAYISEPDNLIAANAAPSSNTQGGGFSTINPRNLGFNSRIRRLRLGVEGTLPSDFGYKFEADFANAAVGFGDVILTYSPKGKPWNIALGNQESLDGLEQISSSRFLSFMERAQFNDAFNNTRRLGVNLGFVNSAGDFRFNVGAFVNHSIDATFNNEGWIAAARAVYAPQAMGGQLHFGVNYQHREYGSQFHSVNYQARPFQQTTDVRFVQTGALPVNSDDIIGVEALGIFGPLHVNAEGQYLRSKTFRAGTVLNPLDISSASTFAPTDNPEFWGGYAEIGYFFTGETRGYKNGQWDRTKVLRPLGKDGGWGALQGNLRVDYLNLNDKALRGGGTINYATGVVTAPNAAATTVNFLRGGEQIGYQASLIWIPQDYVRFILQYVHSDVTGGPIAAVVNPTSTKLVTDRSYGVDSVGVRAQFDF